jgi:hypothetical protein
LAVVAGFVPIEEIEGAGPIAEGAKGRGGAGAWVDGRGIVFIHFDFEGEFLNGYRAHEAPAGDGNIFDQGALDFVLGCEGALEGSEEIGKCGETFVFEDNRLGEQAVTEAVGGGTGFRFGRFGPGGLGAVGARGADSTF